MDSVGAQDLLYRVLVPLLSLALLGLSLPEHHYDLFSSNFCTWGWYARPLLTRYGRRSVLILGGGLYYAYVRAERSPPPYSATGFYLRTQVPLRRLFLLFITFVECTNIVHAVISGIPLDPHKYMNFLSGICFCTS